MIHSEETMKVCQALTDAGGKVFCVGGATRDLQLDIDPKDIDLEVFGLTADEVAAALSTIGKPKLTGEQFGVFKINIGKHEYDVALPRREISTGPRHIDFEFVQDPYMMPAEAALRRDFTINSISYDPLTREIIDPMSGMRDLDDKLLRTNQQNAFDEDPLRMLRAMQIISRFKLKPALSLIRQAKENTCYHTITKERIWIEWEKWARSEYPDLGLEFLAESDLVSRYPQLHEMMRTPQDKRWHPEGNVWIHTLQVVRMAAWISRDLPAEEKRIAVLAALCHDMGKPSTTEIDGLRITSINHCSKGVPVARSFLKSIHAPGHVVNKVLPLVREHLAHASFKPGEEISDSAVLRLAERLHPATVKQWINLVGADLSGRSVSPARDGQPFPHLKINDQWRGIASRLQIESEKPEPLIKGKHLIERGEQPGPKLGAKLKDLYDRQLNGDFTTVEGGMAAFSQPGYEPGY